MSSQGRGDNSDLESCPSWGHTMSLSLSAGPLPQWKAAGCRAPTGSACLVHANYCLPRQMVAAVPIQTRGRRSSFCPDKVRTRANREERAPLPPPPCKEPLGLPTVGDRLWDSEAYKSVGHLSGWVALADSENKQ